MVALANNAEGGTDTTAATTANSGGKSGDAWDAVEIGGSGAITFDNDHAERGALAYKVVGDASANTMLTWNTKLGTLPELWGRVYVWLSALPSSAIGLVRVRNAGSQVARVQIDTAGHVEIRQANNNLLAETSAAVATGQWVRIEWHVRAKAANGTVEVRLYNSANSTIATETVSSTTATLLDNLTEVQTGHLGVASPATLWLDGLAVSTEGWLGLGDFPFDIAVAGEVMRVSSVTPAGWDTFTRTVANGWGTATSGHVWQTAGGASSDRQVTGTAATLTIPSSPTTVRRQWLDETLTGTDVLVSLTPSQLSTGGDQQPGVLFRVLDAAATAYYRVRLQLRPNGSIGIVATGVTTTLTGATATGAGASATPDYLVTPDADAADIAVGDLVKLYDVTGTLKEETIFRVTQKSSAFGFTNISFTPNAAGVTLTGDQLRAVTAATTQIGATEETQLTYAAGSLLWLRARVFNHKIQGRVWSGASEAAEPQHWHITRNATTDLIQAGGAGVGYSLGTGNTNVSPVITWDDFEIYNPQRFTVIRSINGVVKAHSAGAAVSLARPAVAGL